MAIHLVVRAKRIEIERLCEKHHVRRLELFGSATREDFDPMRSDLDFLVDFEALSPEDRSDSNFGLLLDLEDLFQRRIDLVERRPIRNPYFLEDVERSKVLLYAA